MQTHLFSIKISPYSVKSRTILGVFTHMPLRDLHNPFTESYDRTKQNVGAKKLCYLWTEFLFVNPVPLV